MYLVSFYSVLWYHEADHVGNELVCAEAEPYFKGEITVSDAATAIQRKVSAYLNA